MNRCLDITLPRISDSACWGCLNALDDSFRDIALEPHIKEHALLKL